jgi:hypothetical protein
MRGLKTELAAAEIKVPITPATGMSRGPPSEVRSGILIGYARCSTERQDRTAQREILLELGVAEDRIYLDHRADRTQPVSPRAQQRTGRGA